MCVVLLLLEVREQVGCVERVSRLCEILHRREFGGLVVFLSILDRKPTVQAFMTSALAISSASLRLHEMNPLFFGSKTHRFVQAAALEERQDHDAGNNE